MSGCGFIRSFGEVEYGCTEAYCVEEDGFVSQLKGEIRLVEVWEKMVIQAHGSVLTGRNIVGVGVMDGAGEVSNDNSRGGFCVAVDAWNIELDVVGDFIDIWVVARPVFLGELVDLCVEELRAELVLSGGGNAGDSIV